ncbi:hypothetical protein [Solibacillus sp.]|uniref:hypothetical protein n=1 Tax=Solibacillus sp. TaxID=1909654 RepID=UPI0033148E86
MQIVFVILIWVIPSILLTSTYLKMQKEVQQQFKSEFKQPLVFIFLGMTVSNF